MNENSATNGPRVITHHLEGYTITEEHHEITDGSLKCDCTITDAQGEFVRRYAKLEDARGYVRAHVDMERIKGEVRQSQGQQPQEIDDDCFPSDDDDELITDDATIAGQKAAEADCRAPLEQKERQQQQQHRQPLPSDV